MKPKIIARHLPQFHTITENDQRRGEGFTERTTLKKAEPLYESHKQPVVPKDNFYYNFLDIKTRKRQADIAKKYGIDGFCYYHYRFNGKLLLEKGLEKMLEDGEPDIEFCFSRANGSWSKTRGKKLSDEILIEQAYPGEGDDRKHIKYLLSFFLHKNYIKIDNKPVFVIHNPYHIPNLDATIKIWDSVCKDNGFDGIYIIETKNQYTQRKTSQLSEAMVQFEPIHSLGNMIPFVNSRLLSWIPYPIKSRIFQYIQKVFGFFFKKTGVVRIQYDSFLQKIVDFGKQKQSSKTFLGICPGRDNTPRKFERGIILDGKKPDVFQKHFSNQYKNAVNHNHELFFVNARNEWSEGAYLEPDAETGYQYLEAIKKSKDSCSS